MEPSIGRSIGEGFRTANKSWPGIGLVAGSWVVVGLFVILAVMLTRVPDELFRQPPAASTPEEAAITEPTPPAAPPAAETTATPPMEDATATDQPADLFQQMAKTEEIDVSEPATAAATAADTASQAAQREERAQYERAMDDWFKRAWPMLLFCVLVVIAANIWINGGEIGYLAQRIKTQQARLSDFWKAGAHSFIALIGASLLGLLVIGAGALVVGLLVMAGGAFPDAARGILVVLGVLFMLVAFVWIAVRLSFWFVAIVADGVGPIAGLTASLRASRGRWWRLAGLGILMALISYGIWLPFGLIEWAGNFIGGAAALVLGIFSNICAVLASLYMGFVTLAAYIRFYEDAKSAGTSASA